jgi:hypothetical protein
VGHTRLRKRGDPNSDEGTDTLGLCVLRAACQRHNERHNVVFDVSASSKLDCAGR